MIDPKLFTVEGLLSVFLDSDSAVERGNAWRKFAEIIPEYRRKYGKPEDPPLCAVRWGDSYLRYSKGPGQGHFWDLYPDDYLTPSLALLALLEAAPPLEALSVGVHKLWREDCERKERERQARK